MWFYNKNSLVLRFALNYANMKNVSRADTEYRAKMLPCLCERNRYMRSSNKIKATAETWRKASNRLIKQQQVKIRKTLE